MGDEFFHGMMLSDIATGWTEQGEIVLVCYIQYRLVRFLHKVKEICQMGENLEHLTELK